MKKTSEPQGSPVAAARPARPEQLPTGGGVFHYDPRTKVMAKVEGVEPTPAETHPATTGEQA